MRQTIVTFYLFLIVLLALFIIKIIVYYQMIYYNDNKFKIGNAQILGNCERQNDYFSVKQYQNKLFAVVADGLTDLPTGKFASVMAVEMMKYYYDNMNDDANLIEYFKKSFGDIEDSIHRNIVGNKTGTAIICAVIIKKTLQWASIGGCGFYIYRNGELLSVNHNGDSDKRMIHGTLLCKKNDILLFCTEGIYKGASELELKEILSTKQHPYKKAMLLSNIIKQKGYISQKNGTAVIVEI